MSLKDLGQVVGLSVVYGLCGGHFEIVTCDYVVLGCDAKKAI